MYEHGTILQRPLIGRLGKLYKHVGIYIGKNRVIHFNGMGPGDKQVARLHTVSLSEFSDSQPVSVRLEPCNKRHGRAIVRYARQLQREHSNPYNHRYSFAFRNCEDFCRHCYRVALEGESEGPRWLPFSQRSLSLVRVGRAVSLGYAGARLGRLAGPYGMALGAVAGGVAGLVLDPYLYLKSDECVELADIEPFALPAPRDGQ